MTGSTLSLDSLSSPSPSPSPPPETKQTTEPTSAGLDSDSELSELTEEEQEANNRNVTPRRGVRNGAARRGRRPSRRGGRRKTSSLVPAPMWGWAETKSANVVEEEEEEEMAGPPRAMEEEEDEEGARDDDDEDEEPLAKRGDAAMEEEDDPPAAEEDEDESASDDDTPGYQPRRSTRKPSPCRSVERSIKNDKDVDVDADDASDVDPPAQADEPESEDDNGNETESEDEGDDEKDTAVVVDTDDRATATATPMDIDVDVDPDITAPPPQDIAPLAAAAAASSIMAGSGVIEPPSPSSSQRSTPASSRSASPAPGTDVEEPADLNAAEEDAVPANNADIDTNEQDGVEDQDQEVDDGDMDDTNPDDDGDNEVESDLQPAHRAEALDVLATIELKFALLRERVYVEKMEGLAWEEAMVNEGTHPELLHLHRELSTRRDKRVELATRKRELEIINVNKRRRTDEDATWSWWKVARDDLQTDMIAETNRKRRRMEREHRASDRPQPVRPLPNVNQEFPLAPPLRKIIKSLPFTFGNTRNKANKRQRHARLLYPELSSLSEYDIAQDLECIFQRERSRSTIPIGAYDMPQPHRVNNSIPYNNPAPYTNGIGPGVYSASATHQTGYDGYNDGGPRPYANSIPAVDHRMPNPSSFPSTGPPLQHHHHHLPPPPQPMMAHSHSHGPFAGPPGSRSVHQPHPPPPSLHGSHSHHHHGPPAPFGNADQDIHVSHHSHPHPPPHGHSQSYFPPRRSPSPSSIGILPGGGPPGKMSAGLNGASSWMGSGMGMERVYTGSGPGGGKGGEWGRERDRDGRHPPDDDERDRVVRERERDKQREREREYRDREREIRDRERDEIERERHREMHHMHQHPQHQQMPPQHRHQPLHPHIHLHSGPGSQPPHHHVNTPHHHHRAHHHHVLHHHHQPSSGAPLGHSAPSMQPQVHLSPRSTQRERERERGDREREYENRPHPGHNQHPTEVINLTSSKPTASQYHDHHPPPPDFRDGRSKHGRTPSSGPSSSMIVDDRDRPLAMPFALPPSHANHAPPSGPSSMNGRASPHNAWNTSDDSGFRGPPSLPGSSSGPPPPPGSYHGPSEGVTPHTRSPTQSHRYPTNGRGAPPPVPSSQQPSRQNSLGLHSPPRPTLPRPPVPPVPSSPTPSNSAPTPYSKANANPNHSPSRFGAPHSPPIPLKLRPSSPHSNKMPVPYAVLSGPGRTSTPTAEAKNGNGAGSGYSVVSRPPEGYQGPGRGFMNGMNDRDRDQERERERDKERERERPPPPHFGPPPPPPAPSKMISVPQMVDGH